MLAAKDGNLEGLKYLESLGVDINQSTSDGIMSAMDYASYSGRIEIVKYLLPRLKNKSKNPTGPMSHLSWAIDYADQKGATLVAKFLIKSGVDLNIEKSGVSFVGAHTLSRGISPEILKIFLSRNVNWDVESQWGSTPIFEAVKYSINATRALLQKKVKLNLIHSLTKLDILQTAIKAGNGIAVSLLLDAGLKPDIVNRANNKTAIQYANENNRKWLVPILEGKKRIAIPNWSLDDEIASGVVLNYVYKGNMDLVSVGGSTKLSSYWGTKTILLNIWATWCPPCVTEMPALQAFYNSNKSKGFEIKAQSVDEKPDDALKFMESNKLSFPSFTADLKYTRTGDSPYSTSVLLATYILDKNGMGVAFIQGSRDWTKPHFQRFMDLILAIPKWY